MNPKPLWVLFASFWLSTQLLGAQQQEHKLTLELKNKILEVKGNLPKNLTKGDTVLVVIENAGQDTVGWKFKLGGNYMQRIQNAPLQFKATVQTEASEYDLIFEPGTSSVELKDSPLKMIGSKKTAATKSPPPHLEKIVRLSEKDIYNRSKNVVNLYFNEHGLPYVDKFPTDVDDNDIINVYIIAPKNELQNYYVEVEGKFASSDDIVLQSAVALTDLRKLIDSGVLQSTALPTTSETETIGYLGEFGPYAAPSITINIKKKDEEGKEKDLRIYPVRINSNYVGSLRFGVAKSGIQFNKYELKKFAGSDSARLLNVADADGELRYFLTVVFYGWRCWKDNFWNGRDLDEIPTCKINQNFFVCISERINPLVGIGLKDFGTEYLAGFSFEVARGLDIIGGEHFAKVKELAGNYKEGDVFNGDATAIPTQEKWKHRWFWGASVDLIIATKVLGSLFGN